MKYICKICGYIYDEEKERKAFASLPDDWKCPACGARKSAFVILTEEKEEKETEHTPIDIEMKELTAAELSAVFSNLARGCEKQYESEARKLYAELSSYFNGIIPEPEKTNIDALSELIEQNLTKDYPNVKAIAKENGDRGTQRICVWGEKVTNMLSSLLERYKTEGESFLEHTDVWVCTVCGFIYIGNEAPKLCPVCKVPDWKFEKIERRV